MNAPIPVIRGIRCYIQCCMKGTSADIDEDKDKKESESDSSSGSLTRS